ncbi:MAG: peptidylprolyl isomerase, partial [Bacilli bacterium]|nr:peptidylprolyl isomerase [Bacilli bacterium]
MKNKKIILGLSALMITASLFTTGCGKKVEISKKAVVGFEEGEIKANDFYKEIKADNISKLIDLIDHKLLDEKFKTDDEENESVKKQIDSIKSYYTDEAQFNQVIKQYFGAEDEKDLEAILRIEYKREQAVNKYIEDHLSDNEISKYYEENIFGDMSAKHILITADVASDASDDDKKDAEEKALEKAKDIIKQLNDGKKFDDLAKKYSKDESNAKKGGDLGKFSYDDMVKEFSEACAKLKVNEYTKEPVKTQYGYHIILKTGEEKKPTLKKVKSDIKEKLREQKLNDDATLYYETLKNYRKDNGITWNDSELKKAYEKYMNDLVEAAKNQ